MKNILLFLLILFVSITTYAQQHVVAKDVATDTIKPFLTNQVVIKGILNLPKLTGLGLSTDSALVLDPITKRIKLRGQVAANDTGKVNTTGKDIVYGNLTFKHGQNFQDTINSTSYINQHISRDSSLVVASSSDTLNNGYITFTPSANVMLSRSIYGNSLVFKINKNSTYKYGKTIFRPYNYNSINENDSINTVKSFFNTNNTKGYILNGGGFVSNYLQNPITLTRAKTQNLFSLECGIYTSSTATASINIIGDASGFTSSSQVGNLGTHTIDTLRAGQFKISLLSRATGILNVNTVKMLDIVALRGGTNVALYAGIRTVTNMYGIFMANISGVTGSSNHYGIYENFGKNYFTNSVTTKDSLISLKGARIAGPLIANNIEYVANKSTATTLGTSNVLYPTQNAVKTYVDNASLGLNWIPGGELINVIGDTIHPILAPALYDAYIVNTGANVGPWAWFTPGDLIQYQGVTWQNGWVLIDQETAGSGEWYICSGKSTTAPCGQMIGKNNQRFQITGGAPGAFTYTFTVPLNNDALYIDNDSAYFRHMSFTYSAPLLQWIQLSATIDYTFDGGLLVNGVIISVDTTSTYVATKHANLLKADKATTLTINGAAQNLAANRTWNVGTVTSVGYTAGTGITLGGTASPITTSGSFSITNSKPDTANIAGLGISIARNINGNTFTNTKPDTALVAGYGILIGRTLNGNTLKLDSSKYATSAKSGFLKYSDWVLFNSKEPAFTTLPVTKGGTGVATTTAYGVVCGGTTATGAFQNAGAGAVGQDLVSAGPGSLPQWIKHPKTMMTFSSSVPLTNGAGDLLFFLNDNTNTPSNTNPPSIAVGTQRMCAITGTLGNLYVQISAAPGLGTSRAFTVWINGVATLLTCTVTGAATTANNTATSVSVTAGDRISVAMQNSTPGPGTSDGGTISFNIY